MATVWGARSPPRAIVGATRGGRVYLNGSSLRRFGGGISFFLLQRLCILLRFRLTISTSLPADSDDYQNPSNLTHVVYHHLAPQPPQPPPYHNNNPPLLFSNGLEYLYTGKGFGAEAFEILFDSLEPSSRDHYVRGGLIQTTM